MKKEKYQLIETIYPGKKYSIDFYNMEEMIKEILLKLDEEGKQCFVKSSTRYEFYEPDVWISAYFTMKYLFIKETDLESENRIKGIANDYASNIEFTLPFDTDIQLDFCRGYKQSICCNIYETGRT